MSKVLHLGLAKAGLPLVDGDAMCGQEAEQCLEMFLVLRLGAPGHKDVIKVHKDEVNVP